MPLSPVGGLWSSLATRDTSSRGPLLHLPGPCLESRVVGWRAGENGGSPGVSTAPTGSSKDASWSPSASETSSSVFWGSGLPGRAGSSFWAGGLADSASTRIYLGAPFLGWEEAGPTRPGLVLHAELDKVGDSAGPGLLSLANCCSSRAFLNAELELGTAGVARVAGTGLGVAPILSARAPENLAKYCLTTGSCGATGGWLEAGGKGQGTAASYSAKLFGS